MTRPTAALTTRIYRGNQMPNRIDIVGLLGKDVTKETVRAQMAAIVSNTDLLEIYIDSDGGSVSEGMGIIDMIEQYPGPTKSIISSAAFSMASAIAAACDQRAITRNGLLMLHEPRLNPEGMLTVATMRNEADNLERVRNKLLQIYSESMQKPVADVAALFDRGDVMMTAEEAKAVGLVDEILGVTRPTVLALGSNIPLRMVAMLTAADDKPTPKEPGKMAVNLADLKTRMPRMYAAADPKTILAMVERPDATTDDAITAMGEDVVQQNEMLRQRITQLEAELAALKTAPVVPPAAGEFESKGGTGAGQVLAVGARAATTVPPLPATGGTGTASQSAEEEWYRLVNEIVAKGTQRTVAVRQVGRTRPDLRERVIMEANNGRKIQ